MPGKADFSRLRIGFANRIRYAGMPGSPDRPEVKELFVGWQAWGFLSLVLAEGSINHTSGGVKG